MGIIGWIVFGLIVGAVASFLTPGRDRAGGSLRSCWALLERWWGAMLGTGGRLVRAE